MGRRARPVPAARPPERRNDRDWVESGRCDFPCKGHKCGVDSFETYVLDPNTQGGSEVLRLLSEGKHPLCPRCKTRRIAMKMTR